MKLILELDKEDIDITFKEAYYQDQISVDQLERYHFSDSAQYYWDDTEEVWFIQRAVIQQDEHFSYELSPKRTRLK